MAQFSLIEALEKLYIDPFPTKKYRSIVRLLKNIPMILKKLHEVRVCCIDDIIAALSISLEEIPEILRNRFVPTTEVYKMLTQNQVPQKFNTILVKLLFYIVYKLGKCTSEDARSILYDFRELQYCIFFFRKYSTWDNTDLDDTVMMFQRKLIRMVKEMKMENCEAKFHLFSIMRMMIMDIGEHPVYTAPTIKYLNEEVKNYYQHPKSLEPKISINEYVFEIHLTYLCILNELIGRNFINNNKDDGKAILADLRSILKDIAALNRMRPREAYLSQNIQKIIEVYQLK